MLMYQLLLTCAEQARPRSPRYLDRHTQVHSSAF